MTSVRPLLATLLPIILLLTTLSCKKLLSPSADSGNQSSADLPLPAPQEASSVLGDEMVDDELSLTTTECKASSNLNLITYSPSGELFINDIDIINNSRAKAGGKWSFGYALREILELPVPGTSPTLLAAEDAKIRQLAAKLTGTQSVNSYSTHLGPGVDTLLSWGKVLGSDKKSYFSFDKAPFKLRAIVNRLDIVKKGKTSTTAGEGRLIYSFFKPGTESGGPCSSNCTSGEGRTAPGTLDIILEYDLAVGTASPEKLTLKSWTKKWHNLKNFLVDRDTLKKGVQPDAGFPVKLEFKDRPGYVQYLETITERFVNRKARLRSNGTTQSSLAQLRVSHGRTLLWSFREIHRDYDAKRGSTFEIVTVKDNPDTSWSTTSGPDKSKALSTWIEANVTCTSAKDPTTCNYATGNRLMPNSIPFGKVSTPLLGADSLSNAFAFHPESTKEAFFRLNTCDGCHIEDVTLFKHATRDDFDSKGNIRAHNGLTALSPFTIGQVKGPRKNNFKNLICRAASTKSVLNLGGDEDDVAERLDYTYRIH